MTAQVLRMTDYRPTATLREPPPDTTHQPSFVCEKCEGNLMQVLPEGIFCNHCAAEYKPFG